MHLTDNPELSFESEWIIHIKITAARFTLKSGCGVTKAMTALAMNRPSGLIDH